MSTPATHDTAIPPETKATAVPGLTAVARTLAIDGLSVAVMAQLAELGIHAILLKGPTVAGWLYEDGERVYGDCDLLVAPADFAAAGALLRSRGFERFAAPPVRAGLAPAPAESWMRGGEQIDLHRSFSGLACPAEVVWSVLSDHTESWPVAGVPVRALDLRAKLLLTVLHAQHHGPQEQPLEDLRRAVRAVQTDAWAAAYRLAERLDSGSAFAATLPRVEGGAALLGRLGPVERGGLRRLVGAAGLPLYDGFERLTRARTPRDRLRVVAAELVPSQTFMRWQYPRTRSGPAALAAAYVRRWAGLLVTVVRLLLGSARALTRRGGAAGGPNR